MALVFLSGVQTALLSASYDNIIFEGKTGYLCREFVPEKRFAHRPANRIR